MKNSVKKAGLINHISFVLIVCTCLYSSISSAQTESADSNIDSTILASISEESTASEASSKLVMPVFNKSKKYKDINDYISKALVFPEEGIETGKSGMMKVQFQIMKDGSTSHIQFIESPGEAFEKNVIDALQNAPLWTPANRNSKPVQTTYQLHINFSLL